MIETICHNKIIIGIIIYKNHHIENNKIEFLTPQDYLLQVGYMNRPSGYKVIPHIHNSVRRETFGTQEVLFIKEGKIRIDFYSYEHVYLESRELSAGDTIVLCGAGHGITILESTIMFEVKNGPFVEGADKGRFEGKKDNM